MDKTSPSTMSSPPRAKQGSMSDNEAPQARVQRPRSVSSASQLPKSPVQTSPPPHMASARYVKQFQTLMEHQRQTFDEERALWNTERMELNDKIAELEALLRPLPSTPLFFQRVQTLMEHQRQRFDEEWALWNTERMELHDKIAKLEGSLRPRQVISSSQVSSPIRNSDKASRQSGSVWSPPTKDGPTSPTTTGHEIWRGSKPDVEPTRTFSDPATQWTKSGDRSRLPSIAEDTTCGRKDSSDTQPGFHKPSISGAVIDKNLDGINFKTTTLPPVSAKKIMTPQSPSPGTLSPSHLSLRTIRLPSSKLEVPSDPYTENAGHTPLARGTYFNADGASSDGNGTTPTQPDIDPPPLEPHASYAKLPSERSDSYFPVAKHGFRDERNILRDQEDQTQSGEDESSDEDPELKGPLGLNDNKGKDQQFLDELDSKLLQAAKSQASSPSSDALDAENVPKKDEEDFEQPEDEPKLRIKRSMNFGSAFGAKTLGKGI